MPVVAIIKRVPKLTRGEWGGCIRELSFLYEEPPQIYANPFTGQADTYRPLDMAATMLVEGEPLGSIATPVRFDELGELHVYSLEATAPRCRGLALEVARALGAELEWLGTGP